MYDFSRHSQPASAAVAQTGVRSRFFGKGVNGTGIKRETWVKRSQKRRMARPSQKLKRGQNYLRKEGWHRYHKNWNVGKTITESENCPSTAI
jgi:hypothetical protein